MCGGRSVVDGKRASAHARAYGQVFNCAGPDCVTTRRYYQLIADRLDVPLHAGSLDVRAYLTQWPERAPFARHRIYDMSRLEESTGYRPRFRLEAAIAESVAWMEQIGRAA